jgi:hypothetical protein
VECALAVCGDGFVHDGEEACDGDDVARETCVTLGFDGGGMLVCDDACSFDTSMCCAVMGAC